MFRSGYTFTNIRTRKNVTLVLMSQGPVNWTLSRAENVKRVILVSTTSLRVLNNGIVNGCIIGMTFFLFTKLCTKGVAAGPVGIYVCLYVAYVWMFATVSRYPLARFFFFKF